MEIEISDKRKKERYARLQAEEQMQRLIEEAE